MTDQINEQLVATARLLKKLDAPLRSQWVVELLDVLRRETRGEDYDFRGTYLGVIQDIAQRMEGELLGYDPDAADESFDDYNNRREREHLESAEYGSDDNSLLDETNPHYDF